jgi:hypothetical protein
MAGVTIGPALLLLLELLSLLLIMSEEVVDRVPEVPNCDSTQLCRHFWWTHFVDPRHLHGFTHSPETEAALKDGEGTDE